MAAGARMNQNQSFRREHLAMADGTFGWRPLGEVGMTDGNTAAADSAPKLLSMVSVSNTTTSNASNNLLDDQSLH